jgi:hypothetical protein
MRWSSHTLWRRVRSSLANFAPFARLGQRLRRCCLVVGCGFSLVVLVLTLLIILLVLTVDRAFGQAPPGDAVDLILTSCELRPPACSSPHWVWMLTRPITGWGSSSSAVMPKP